jgi:hypothetical protein
MEKYIINNYADINDITVFLLIQKVIEQGKISEDMTLYSYATIFTMTNQEKILVATEKLKKSKTKNNTIKFIIQKG